MAGRETGPYCATVAPASLPAEFPALKAYWYDGCPWEAAMGKKELGCCGAYCKTCRALAAGACRGCKIGYDSGERDLSRAKCRIKVCCVSKEFASCADCADVSACDILLAFHGKSGYKYGR